MKFSFENPTRIHFGAGEIARISSEIPKSSKVLVLYGGGSIRQNGVYDQVADALKEHQWGEFGGIEPNPQYETLMQAVALIRREHYDYLLAVGGGSVVDGSKFVAVAAGFQGDDPWQILTDGTVSDQALPMSCVLTLPATGSESNSGAVISRGQDKLFFADSRVRPKFAVLDPKVTLSLSARQSANGIADAFVHVMEQYLTYPIDAKVQDRFAEGLLLTLIEEGPALMAEPDNLTLRANVMWAATLALNGLIGSGVPQDWSTHMIGHEMTGLYGVDHARSLTIVLPAMMKYRQSQKQAKLLQYAGRIFGITDGSDQQRIDAAIRATEDFFRQLQLPVRLSDIGLGDEAIAPLLASLKAHGRDKLSEHGDIGQAECRAVLQLAI